MERVLNDLRKRLAGNVLSLKQMVAGTLPSCRAIMQDLKIPRGLGELGYQASDIPALVEGTLPQHRVTKLSPRPANLIRLGPA